MVTKYLNQQMDNTSAIPSMSHECESQKKRMHRALELLVRHVLSELSDDTCTISVGSQEAASKPSLQQSG